MRFQKLFVGPWLPVFLAGLLHADPQPGDVFKEWPLYVPAELWTVVVDPACKAFYCVEQWKGAPPSFTVNLDLENAIKAELVGEWWGGHVGSVKLMTVNGVRNVSLPQPNTPGDPACWLHTLNGAAKEIPLEHLNDGSNTFVFEARPQGSCSGAGVPGWWWIYSLRVRVYYDKSLPHVEGTITAPASDSWISDNQTVGLRIDGDEDAVDRVEFVGYHDDFPWKGVGVYRQWHFSYRYAQMLNHIGTDDEAPYEVEWDTDWIPDGDEPMQISARIVDRNSMIYMAPPAENLRFARGRIVKMYPADGVPGNFSGVGGRRDCNIQIDDDPSGAQWAILQVSTWNGDNEAGKISFNGTPIGGWKGYHHDRAFIVNDVPTEKLRQGANNIHIDGRGEGGHAFEVNWPGPVLFVEYDNPSPMAAKPGGQSPGMRTSVTLRSGGMTVRNPHGGPYALRVTTANGRTIMSKEGSGTGDRYILNDNVAADGVCIARVTTQNDTRAFRLIISK
jgi:hypothetical protein